MSNQDLNIIIRALLDEKQVNDPKDIQGQLNKLADKLKLNVKFDLSAFDKVGEQIEKSAEKVSKVTKTALKNALKGDMYKDVQKKLNQIMRDVEGKNGSIQKILVSQNAKTGEITKATLQYSDALGKVVTELYQIERKYKDVKDAQGKTKKVLSSVDLVHTNTNAQNDISKQQKNNYDEISKRLSAIEQLKVKLERQDDKTSAAAKEYTKQIADHEKIIKQIESSKIKISAQEKVDALNQNQSNQLAEKRLQTEKKIAQVIAEQNSKTSKVQSGKSYIDANNAEIKKLRTEILKAETGRSGIKDQNNINAVVNEYDALINRIKQVTQQQRALSEQEQHDLERQKMLIKNMVDEYKKLDSKSTISTSGQLTSAEINYQKNELLRRLQSTSNQYGRLVNKDEFKSINEDILKLTTNTQHANQEIKNLGQRIRQLGTNASGEAHKALNVLFHDIEKISQWTISGGIVFGAQDGIKSYIETLADVERGMAGIQQVIPEVHSSQTELNSATMQFVGIAEKYGQSIDDVLTAGKLWGRQYKDLNTVLELVNSTTLLSVVDNLSLEEANRSLEATMVQFGMIIDQTKSKTEQQAEAFEYSRKITDAWSSVAHQSMASAQDLAQGMERTGSVAKQMGLDFDSANALIATSVRNTGLAGANLGNMWKTVLGSIHSDKAVDELESIGVKMKQITVDGKESWTSAKSVLEQMMIMSAGTEKSLEEVERAAAGGKYQYAKLAASVSDLTTYYSALEQSIMSTGSTMEYADVQLETLSKRFDTFKQHLIGLTETTGSGGLSDGLKSIVNTGINLVSGLEKMDASTIAFWGTVSGLILLLPKLVSAITATTVAIEAQAGAMSVLDALSGNWAGLVAGAVAVGFTLYATNAGKAAEEQQKLNDAIAEANKTAPQIADQYKRRASEIDNIIQNIKILQEQLNSPEAQNNPQRKKALEEDYKATIQFFKDIAGVDFVPKINKAKTIKEFSDLGNEIKDALNSKADISGMKVEQGKGLDVTIENLTERYVQLKQALKDTSLTEVEKAKSTSELHTVTDELLKVVPSLSLGWGKNGEQMLKLDSAIGTTSGTMEHFLKIIHDAMKVDIGGKINDQTKQVADAKKNLDAAQKDFNIASNLANSTSGAKAYYASPENMKQLRDRLDAANKEYQKQNDQLGILKGKLAELNITLPDTILGEGDLGKVTGETADTQSEAITKLNDYIDANHDLADTYKKLQDGQQLSAKEIMDLVANHQELSSAIENQNGVLSLNKEAVKKLMDAKQAEFKSSLTSIKNELDAQEKALATKLGLYIKEIDAIQSVEEAKQLAAQKTQDKVDEMRKKGFTVSQNDAKWLGDNLDSQLTDAYPAIKEIQDKKKEIQSLLDADINSSLTVDTSKAKQATDDAAKDAKNLEAIHEQNYENQKSQLENIISLQQQLRDEQVKGSTAEQYYINKEIENRQEKVTLLEKELKHQQALSAENAKNAKLYSQASASANNSSTYNGKYADAINSAASANGIDPGIVVALATQESSLGKTSNNVMQVNGMSNATPEASIKKGTEMIAGYLKKYSLEWSLAAYNMGEGIIKWANNNGIQDPREAMKQFSAYQKKTHGYSVYGDTNYIDHVLRYYKGDKNGTDFAQQSADAEGKVISISAEIQNELREITKLKTERLDSFFQSFANNAKKADDAISASQARMGLYNETSKEYRNELTKQNQLLQEKQKQLHGEANEIRWNIAQNQKNVDELNKLYQLSKKQKLNPDQTNRKKYLESIILDPAKIAEWEDTVKQLGVTYNDVTKEINDNSIKINLDPLIKAFDDADKAIKDNIDNIQRQLDNLDKDDKNYYSDKASLINQLISQHQSESNALQDNINKLKEQNSHLSQSGTQYQANKDQIEEWENQLKSSTNTIADLNQELINNKKELANSVVDLYKEVYEKEKEAALDAIDKEMKAEDKRHQSAMDNLDDEMKKKEDAINAELKLIDKLKDEDDWNKRLADAQKEQQDLQNEINVLSLDNSYEAKAKKEELEKQLADKTDEINQMKTDRETDLRKQSLQDQLDAYKKDVDAKKQAEDDKYNAEKERLDQEKEYETQYWENKIEDERHWTQVREDIMNGHMSAIKDDFNTFKDFLNDNMTTIGESITQNLIDKINSARDALNNLNRGGSSSSGSSSSGSSSSSSGSGSSNIGNVNMPGSGSSWGTDYGDGSSSSTTVGSDGGWTDTYTSGGKTWTSNDGGNTWIEKKHDGGFVGDSKVAPTPKMKLINDLFNVKPGEKVIKSLIGELQIPQKNVPNFFTNMKNLLATKLPQMSMDGAGGSVYNVNLNIGSLTGDKKGADYLFTEIKKGFKKLGK